MLETDTVYGSAISPGNDTLGNDATVWEGVRHAAQVPATGPARPAGAFMFRGPQPEQPAAQLSGGEDPARAGRLGGLTANVLLLDRRPLVSIRLSREQLLLLHPATGSAVVLVTHDPGAAALDLTGGAVADGTEDYWSARYGLIRAGLT